jgi:hypothetical protein
LSDIFFFGDIGEDEAGEGVWAEGTTLEETDCVRVGRGGGENGDPSRRKRGGDGGGRSGGGRSGGGGVDGSGVSDRR